jgi:serine/threonine protein phosphatase PrpC
MTFDHLASAVRTDVGRSRTNNEDAVAALNAEGVFAVADGMGGEGDGEIASARVCEAVRRAVTPAAGDAGGGPLPLELACRRIEQALDDASHDLCEHARARTLTVCGSTVVALVFDCALPWQAVCLYAGDSPAYRCRDGRIDLLTRDHTFASAVGAVQESLLPPRLRGLLTRAVGIHPTVLLDRVTIDVRNGDRFVLCTDGLPTAVPPSRIVRLMRRSPHPGEVADALVAEALAAGAPDNVTVCVVDVGPLPRAG